MALVDLMEACNFFMHTHLTDNFNLNISVCGSYLQDAGVVVIKDLSSVGREDHLVILGPGKVGLRFCLNFTGEVYLSRHIAVRFAIVTFIPQWFVCQCKIMISVWPKILFIMYSLYSDMLVLIMNIIIILYDIGMC